MKPGIACIGWRRPIGIELLQVSLSRSAGSESNPFILVLLCKDTLLCNMKQMLMLRSVLQWDAVRWSGGAVRGGATRRGTAKGHLRRIQCNISG